ncbi:hypothetical protein JXC34_05055 [Candidatus Woesearchaeota archaeon]|nr:hypothetical protein [Candidatus Woesearchaeota archaeon]
MRKKIIFAAGIIALIIMISSWSVKAYDPDRYIFLTVGEDINKVNISVVEDTAAYIRKFFVSIKPETENYTVRFYDAYNETVAEDIFYKGFENRYIYLYGLSSVKLFDKDTVVFEKNLGFCNNNGLCEPCFNESCSLYENVLTCSDCNSGGSDGYCDLYRDGICDPDCNNIDLDCQGCNEMFCVFRDTFYKLPDCEADYGGEICLPGEKCTGRFIYAPGAGSLCCIKGECMKYSIFTPKGVNISQLEKPEYVSAGEEEGMTGEETTKEQVSETTEKDFDETNSELGSSNNNLFFRILLGLGAIALTVIVVLYIKRNKNTV